MRYVVAVILLMGVFVSIARGHSYHDHDLVTVTEHTTITNTSQAKGLALGIAKAQHQFDLNTYNLQGSLAAGSFKSKNAVSFALGKRICTKKTQDCALFNGSVGLEEGDIGVGGAINWKFK